MQNKKEGNKNLMKFVIMVQNDKEQKDKRIFYTTTTINRTHCNKITHANKHKIKTTNTSINFCVNSKEKNEKL